MFIETKGPSLEEVALLFDEMNANIGGTGRLVPDALSTVRRNRLSLSRKRLLAESPNLTRFKRVLLFAALGVLNMDS